MYSDVRHQVCKTALLTLSGVVRGELELGLQLEDPSISDLIDIMAEFELAKKAYYSLDKYLESARVRLKRVQSGAYAEIDGSRSAMLQFQPTTRTSISPAGKLLLQRENLYDSVPATNIKILVSGEEGL